MRVLLTGGTGFVGSSVLTALVASGHEVTAVVRSDEAAAKVTAAGAKAVVHALPETEWLAGMLRESDGAIHTATPGDDTGAAFDDSVIDAVITAFAGTDHPYIHTGGVWVHGNGSDITETTPVHAPQITAWREEREKRILGSGVKASVIEPGIVYGYGKGIPNMITGAPRSESGALHLIGTGEQHWATVHVDDLADLYVDVLERGPGGESYIGASGQSPTVREMAQAFVGPDGALEPESFNATRERLSPAFAEALLLDQQASGEKAKTAFGWNPHRTPLVEELAEQHAAG